MRTVTFTVCAVLLLLNVSVALALTPIQIIAMTRAGQSAEAIILAIQQDKTHTKLSATELLTLQKAGVAKDVLQFLTNTNKDSPDTAKTQPADARIPPTVSACPHCNQNLLLPANVDTQKKLNCSQCGQTFLPTQTVATTTTQKHTRRTLRNKLPRTIHYGWKIAVIDLSVIALAVTVVLIDRPSYRDEDWLNYIPAAGYFLGGPIVHIAHGNKLTWLWSGLARWGLPGVGMGLGILLPCKGWDCVGSMAIGAGIGAAGAMVLDSVVLAQKTQITLLPPSAFNTRQAPYTPQFYSPSDNPWGLGLSGRF